jgi:preprotein translocase subunit SecB
MENNSESIKPGAFSLQSYRVTNFSFTEPILEKHKLNLNLVPTGVYFPKQKRFSLSFNFTAFYNDNNIDIPIISITTTAEFAFDDEATLDSLPNYFFSNSIAIVFPFVRAFVATLTTIANVKQIMQDILKDNTTIDESAGFPFIERGIN